MLNFFNKFFFKKIFFCEWKIENLLEFIFKIINFLKMEFTQNKIIIQHYNVEHCHGRVPTTILIDCHPLFFLNLLPIGILYFFGWLCKKLIMSGGG
jgi:hypothetical protein